MRIVEFSLRRRVTVWMCTVALVLFGLVAFGRLPLNLMPDLSYPSLTVETQLPGAAPAEVETLLTRPIEEVVGIVGGVQRLTSASRPGLSQVTLEFGWGRNMDFAALDVRQKLDLVRLPDGATKPLLLRFDPANDPVMRLYLTGGQSLYELRYVAEELVKKDLEPTEGVAAIKVHGGYEEEIEVRIDEGRLALLGLGIDQVNDRLLRENLNQAGGSLYESEARYLVRARNEFRNLDDIRSTVVLTQGGRRVTVGDVATVSRTHKQREVISRYDGREAVELAVYKEGDANTVQVARSVASRLERTRKELPEGVEIVTGADQSRFIQASVREVLSNALLGGLVAIVVLLLFLKDVRATLVVGLAIPISIVATFFLMYRTGTSLNVMSLGGLALGVGMLVDSAIVVLEAIVRRREEGLDAVEAARVGASEVGQAVIASTLTTIAVFLPVVFLEGIAAQLFRDTALTVSFSLLAALVVSLTLIPMLTALGGGRPAPEGGAGATPGRVRRLLRAIFTTGPSLVIAGVRRVLAVLGRALAVVAWPASRVFDAILGRVTAGYPRLLSWSLGHRGLVLAVVAGVVAVAAALVPRLGFDLIPPLAQGELSFRVELPEGTTLALTDGVVSDAAAAVEEASGVESVSTVAGGAGLSLTSTGTEGENIGRILVRLAPGAGSEVESAVAAVLREHLETVPEAAVKQERGTSFSFRTPIEVEVYSQDLGELHAVAADIARRMAGVPGLVDVRASTELGNPEVQVRFRREALASLGLELSRVAQAVRTKIQGDVATRFTEGDREIDIRVRALEHGAASVGDVGQLIVGHGGGRPIFLSSVADIRLTEGPTEVRRIGQRRAALVWANLEGRDMAGAAADVRAVLRSEPLPAGVSTALSGQEEEMQRSFRSLMLAMGLAVFLVYLVMASQFESFLHPFVIIFTLPLGAVGVILALAVTGTSLNVVAIIGAVMLAGIVVNNAIVLIDAVNQRRRAGLPKAEALIEAGSTRLRPILMTSATTIFGLLPMALGLGEGAELRAPLAITVIGGLSVATLLTLVVIPVVYSLFDREALVVPTREGAEEVPVPAGDPVAAG